MIIICVGMLSVFDNVIKLNRGTDIRAQAETVLQKKVEFYRALKYQPVGPDPLLNGHAETLAVADTNIPSADGTLFDVYVTIDNDPYTAGIQTGDDANCKFKEITLRAVLHNPESGWLQNLNAKVTFQRVRLIY
jgi:hypothetical protein